MNESFKNSEFILDVTHSVGDIIYNVYNQGYEDGLKDGKESVQINESTPAAYEAGLEAAWELARKLYNLGFNDTRKEIFGEKYGLSIDIIKDFSVDEVMTKIKDIPIRCENCVKDLKIFVLKNVLSVQCTQKMAAGLLMII